VLKDLQKEWPARYRELYRPPHAFLGEDQDGTVPAHTHSFSPEDLASMMKDAGFAIETSKVIGAKAKAVCIIGQKVPLQPSPH
jgi:hypothetical protein